MIKKILLAFVAILVIGVGIVLALASGKPDTFRVERSLVIAAPVAAIHPHINDLRAWAHWSPYEAKDPDIQLEYGGAPRGVGAWSAWNGDNNVGEGRMEIVESTPQHVRLRLDFVRPMEASNGADFTLTPEGNSTRVSWAMDGKAMFVTKVMQVLVDFDGLVGRDFEEGLAKLKQRVESQPVDSATP